VDWIAKKFDDGPWRDEAFATLGWTKKSRKQKRGGSMPHPEVARSEVSHYWERLPAGYEHLTPGSGVPVPEWDKVASFETADSTSVEGLLPEEDLSDEISRVYLHMFRG
jgi:hypothetical protein